jgi:hypothetical protein
LITVSCVIPLEAASGLAIAPFALPEGSKTGKFRLSNKFH